MATKRSNKKQNCGPSSKPCGSICIPHTKNCRQGFLGAALGRARDADKVARAMTSREQNKLKSKKFTASGITLNPVTAKEFYSQHGSLKGKKNKIKRVGEFAANFAGAVALSRGVEQAAIGALTGNVGNLTRGIRTASLGQSTLQLAAASRASRQGRKQLSKDLLSSSAKIAAFGVGQEALIGAYGGFKRSTFKKPHLKTMTNMEYKGAKAAARAARGSDPDVFTRARKSAVSSWKRKRSYTTTSTRSTAGFLPPSRRDSLWAVGFTPDPRSDAFIGSNRKLNCGPGSKPCGNACIPRSHKCRASWNKPVKVAAGAAALTGAALVGTAFLHPRSGMRAAARSVIDPVAQAGYAAGNAARGNWTGAARNAANVAATSQNLGRDLTTLRKGYSTDIKNLYNKGKEAAFKARHHRPAKG